MKNFLKNSFNVAKRALIAWSDDRGSILAGALSFYTLFSVAPLLLVAIAVCGFIFGNAASRGEIFSAIAGLLGPSGASAIQAMVQSSSAQPHTGVVATVIGIGTILVGASSVFAELQDALNLIWRAKPPVKNGVLAAIRQRFLSFAMVVVIAFLLLVSLLISAALGALGKFLSSRLLGGEILWRLIDFSVSLAIISALFGAIFKVLPDAPVRWSHAWRGGLATAFLFDIGKTLIGLYIGKSGVASAYGAAGSLVIVLLWFYYSSAILLLGAEITCELSKRRQSSGAEVFEFPTARESPGIGIASSHFHETRQKPGSSQ